MKLLAAIGVYVAFGLAIALGIVLLMTSGSVWLLTLGLGAFLFGFVRVGCLSS